MQAQIKDLPKVSATINNANISQQGGAVSSVNGKTGAVELTAADVGALPDTTVIPTDEHINGLISTALGVIENGTY